MTVTIYPTKYERRSKAVYGPVSAQRVVAWCYLCATTHPYAEPCPALSAQRWYRPTEVAE